ncbi:hypothetical protein GCM10009554_61900 [Kribbella koreensis]|uniref:Uncharacterized protein n=1 Tax=Kribbella koreensis TaxID=57909 RepID=A0ABN1RCV3_9ACTN
MKTASERRYEVVVVTSGVGRPSNTRLLAEHLAKTVSGRGRIPDDRIATEIYELLMSAPTSLIRW